MVRTWCDEYVWRDCSIGTYKAIGPDVHAPRNRRIGADNAIGINDSVRPNDRVVHNKHVRHELN